MRRNLRPWLRSPVGVQTTPYPWLSMAAAMMLIYLTPFVSSLCSVLAFAICIYRLVRYDAKVFAADYCILIPVIQIFRISGGVSLFVYLCLLAAVWHTIRGGFRSESPYILLIVLLNFLVARMQLNISGFVLCFGQMYLLCVLLPKQDGASAERAVKLFLASMILSSAYALLIRDTWQLYNVIGAEDEAIYGTGTYRFRGLFRDPNYYMTLLIVGLALLIKLRDCQRIEKLPFVLLAAVLMAFGILTYSKTFFLVLVILVLIYVAWQIRNGRYLFAFSMILLALVAGNYLLFADSSPFSVVMSRFLSANNVSDFTTGRSDVYMDYLEKIVDSAFSFFFGAGLAAESLYKDPHNIYIEIVYYTGAIGLVLFAAFFFSMVFVARSRVSGVRKQNIFAKYIVVVMMLVLYFTLHGMFEVIFYTGAFLALLSVMITKQQDTNTENG